MKNSSLLLRTLGPLMLLAAMGCAHGGLTGDELTTIGPNIMNVRTSPSTIDLDKNMEVAKPAQIFAEVKDFKSNVNEVKLRFIHVPLELNMEHVGGTTWRAELSPDQLKTLAVSGQTMRYDANIVARNTEGQTAVSKEPVQISVKAPDVSKNQG